jgi:hypothetical protein
MQNLASNMQGYFLGFLAKDEKHMIPSHNAPKKICQEIIGHIVIERLPASVTRE